MTTVAPFVAAILLWIQADSSALLDRLKALDNAAATQLVAAETAATREVLDRLIAQVDASVHSDRQRPEQRRVTYDREALHSTSSRFCFCPRYRRPDVCQALRSAQTAPRRHSAAQRPPVPRRVETADRRAGRGTNARRQVAAGHYPRESGIRSSGTRSRPGGPGPIGTGRRDCEHAGRQSARADPLQSGVGAPAPEELPAVGRTRGSRLPSVRQLA